MILSAATADYKKIRADGMHGVGPVRGFSGSIKTVSERNTRGFRSDCYISVLVFQCTNVIIVIIVIIVKLNIPILK